MRRSARERVQTRSEALPSTAARSVHQPTPLLHQPSLRPRAGQVVDLLVPAEPLRLSVLCDGRASLERELSPVPRQTIEISVPLSAPASR